MSSQVLWSEILLFCVFEGFFTVFCVFLGFFVCFLMVFCVFFEGFLCVFLIFGLIFALKSNIKLKFFTKQTDNSLPLKLFLSFHFILFFLYCVKTLNLVWLWWLYQKNIEKNIYIGIYKIVYNYIIERLLDKKNIESIKKILYYSGNNTLYLYF
jgi:hypothetical protein